MELQSPTDNLHKFKAVLGLAFAISTIVLAFNNYKATHELKFEKQKKLLGSKLVVDSLEFECDILSLELLEKYGISTASFDSITKNQNTRSVYLSEKREATPKLKQYYLNHNKLKVAKAQIELLTKAYTFDIYSLAIKFSFFFFAAYLSLLISFIGFKHWRKLQKVEDYNENIDKVYEQIKFEKRQEEIKTYEQNIKTMRSIFKAIIYYKTYSIIVLLLLILLIGLLFFL